MKFLKKSPFFSIPLAFTLVFFLCSKAFAEENDGARVADRNFSLSVECGAGNFASANFMYRFGKCRIGGGFGADYNFDMVGSAQYHTWLLDPMLLFMVNVFTKDVLSLDVRFRLDGNILMVDQLPAETSIGMGPEVMVGFANLYAIGSLSFIFGNKVSILPTFGIGYRFDL